MRHDPGAPGTARGGCLRLPIFGKAATKGTKFTKEGILQLAEPVHLVPIVANGTIAPVAGASGSGFLRGGKFTPPKRFHWPVIHEPAGCC